MDKLAEIKKSRLFRELPDSELEKLSEISREQSFNDGDRVAAEGAESTDIHLIVMGSVRISKRTESGIEEEIAILGSGSYLGETCLLDSQAVTAVSAKALEKTFVLNIPATAFHALCDEDPVVGYHAYRAIARAVERRSIGLVSNAAYYKSLSLHH